MKNSLTPSIGKLFYLNGDPVSESLLNTYYEIKDPQNEASSMRFIKVSGREIRVYRKLEYNNNRLYDVRRIHGELQGVPIERRDITDTHTIEDRKHYVIINEEKKQVFTANQLKKQGTIRLVSLTKRSAPYVRAWASTKSNNSADINYVQKKFDNPDDIHYIQEEIDEFIKTNPPPNKRADNSHVIAKSSESELEQQTDTPLSFGELTTETTLLSDSNSTHAFENLNVADYLDELMDILEEIEKHKDLTNQVSLAESPSIEEKTQVFFKTAPYLNNSHGVNFSIPTNIAQNNNVLTYNAAMPILESLTPNYYDLHSYRDIAFYNMIPSPGPVLINYRHELNAFPITHSEKWIQPAIINNIDLQQRDSVIPAVNSLLEHPSSNNIALNRFFSHKPSPEDPKVEANVNEKSI